MTNPYPANFEDADGTVRFSGQVDFTDAGNQPGGGGSQPFTVVRFAFAFNTPNLILTGVPIYTPAAGDRVVPYIGWLSVPAAWNGTTAGIHLGYAASLAAYDASCGFSGDELSGGGDSPIGAHAVTASVATIPNVNGWTFADAEPLTLMVDDGSGGDPGSTSGTAELVLLVVPASA